MSKTFKEILVGGTWIFLAGIFFNALNFLFWFLVAKFANIDIIGIASAIYSSAIIASTIISSGIDVAIIREISQYNINIVRRFFLVIILLSVASFVISYELSFLIGFHQNIAFISGVLAFFNVMNVILLAVLIGSLLFRYYFFVVTFSSLIRLFIGVLLILFDYGLYALLYGFLASLISSTIFSILIIYKQYQKQINTSSCHNSYKYSIRSLFRLGYANYFFTISNQIFSYIFTYLYMFITRKAPDTGILYISLMIVTVISMFPQALLNASLPISIKEKKDEIFLSLRLGLLASGLLCILSIPLAGNILSILNKDLILGEQVLEILLLAAPFVIVLTMYLMKWNKELNIKNIVIVGFSRFFILILALIVLAPLFNIIGAALAYLLANFLSFIIAFIIDKLELRILFLVEIFLIIDYVFYNIFSLKAFALFYVILYGLMIYKLRLITYNEIILIIDVAKKFFKFK